MTKTNFWIAAVPASSMLCSSQTRGRASCSSRKTALSCKWSGLSSGHLCLHHTQVPTSALVKKWWGRIQGKNSVRKTQLLFTPLHSRGPKLFVIASHCHCSGKEPVSDSLPVSLCSSFYNGTRQKQWSCISHLPIIDTQSLDPDPNFCLQNHGSKPTGWCNFGLKPLGWSSAREYKISLVR